MTPEGRIKRRVREVLRQYAVYQFWPVPYGLGESSLDCLVCFRGRFIAIETKAPGMSLTPRQELCAAAIRAAGGIVVVVSGEDDIRRLGELFADIASSDA